MNKKTLKTLITLLILITATAIIAIVIHNNNIAEAEAEEERQRMMQQRNKAWFGDDMGFEFRIVWRAWDGEEKILSSGSVAITYLSPGSRWGNPYSDLIFVHTKAESLNFPDDIIVAWPRTIEETGEIDVEFYDRLIDGLHWAVNKTEELLARRHGEFAGSLVRPVLTLEEFGLTYPITVEDLVDNWEKIEALWLSFTGDERSRLLGGARAGNLSYREWGH